MYITHSILYWINYNVIHFHEFATNRNPTWAELMRKGSTSGVFNFVMFALNPWWFFLVFCDSWDICGDLRFHGIIRHIFPVDPLRDLNASHTGQSVGLIRENKTKYNLYTFAAVYIKNLNGNQHRNQLHIIYIQCPYRYVHHHYMYEGWSKTWGLVRQN